MTELSTINSPLSTTPRQRRAFGSLGRPFRGEIWENAARFQFVGKAYESMPAEQNGYFRIETCRQLVGPLRAWRHRGIRYTFVRSAVQTQKSMIIDLIIPYIIEHEPRNTLVLFETDPKALTYASVRLMDVLKKHPVIGPMIVEVKQENRFDAISTFIKFPSMTLMIAGLNDGNVSSLPWPNVLISEAWMHKSDGLLFKAFGRTTQFEANCKVLVESQAGEEGEDFDLACKSGLLIPLTWACPHCGGRQQFEFTQKRPEDFKGVSREEGKGGEGREGESEFPEAGGEQFKISFPTSLPSQPSRDPRPGSPCGMTFAAGTRMENGQEMILSMDQRAATAAWECYHCGTMIADTPVNRRRMMDSYEQIIPDPAPSRVTFSWPEEASPNITFAESVRHYLTAKTAEDNGNTVPMADWYMQRRGRAWSIKNTQVKVASITMSAPSGKTIPNECFRSLTVDCQKDKELSAREGKEMTGHFWYIAEAVNKAGDTIELARGYAMSWAQLKAIKERLHIPVRNWVFDGGHWLDAVKDKCAEFREKQPALDGSGRMVWATPKIMIGDDKKSYHWPEDKQWRPYKIPQTHMVSVLANGTWINVAVTVTYWSNFTITSQLKMLQQGLPGKPKLIGLDFASLDKLTQSMEVGDFTYDSQLNGQILGEDAKGRPKYIDLHKQQHYADCKKMGIVLKAMKGLIGHIAAPEEQIREA